MRLEANASSADRAVRVVIGVALAVLTLTGVASGGLAVLAWALAALMIITATVGFCPLYWVLRISTRRRAG